MVNGETSGPDDDTISSYLNALRKIFVVEDAEAWCPALRSRRAIRMSDTRYFSDSSRMFCIGDVSEEKRKLVEVTKECVEKGLEMVKPWTFLGDMGQAVHEHAVKNGYTVVREIGGHGIGLEFHEDPWVSYVSKAGEEMLLVPGMIFTIEPMVNLGSDKIYCDKNDGWTIYTADKKPSAQWEIMVLVTEDGHEVLAY